MSNKDVTQPATVSVDRKKKMPLDVRIVASLGFISALMSFAFVLLLVIGVAHFPSNYQRPVLLGVFHLRSNLSAGVHSFLVGLASSVSAYGLIKGCKFGWWLALVFSLSAIPDSLLMFSDYPVSVTIGICISIGIIIWLVLRRGLYGIGKTSYV